MWKGACNNSFLLLSPHQRQHRRQYSAMKKLLCVVVVSSLLLVTLAGVSSPPLTSSLSRQHAQVLGRKGRALGQFGYRYQHQNKRTQNSEEVVMEVTTPAKKKAGLRTDQGEGGKENGLIDSADYEGVAMHAGSPPKHRHPKP